MAEHTAGPWKTEINKAVHRPSVTLGKDERWEVTASAIEDSTANARLIASAPEMARALQGIRDQAISTHGDNRDVAIPSEVYDLVMQLLDRIEGKEEGRWKP
jgi:hypothetical protein